MSVTPRIPDNDSQVATQNKDGNWVPSIPVPYFLFKRVRCSCGRKFWNMETYKGHYALVHILKI